MEREMCPACGKGELVEDTRDMDFVSHGEKCTVRAVHAQYCTACDEALIGYDESKRVSDELEEFRRQRSAHDSAFIRTVRKKLRLGQKEAGEIFGGGVNAFSRYETGKANPPVSLLKLFRILDTHPDLLALVR